MAATKTQAAEAALPLMEAATAMGLGYASARDRILKGEVEGFQRAGRWFVTRDSIDRWLAREPNGQSTDLPNTILESEQRNSQGGKSTEAA